MDTLSTVVDSVVDTTTQALDTLSSAGVDPWGPATAPAPSMPGAGMLVGIGLACIALVVFSIACCWKIFAKAGKPGWACLIPIYNAIVMLEIVKRPVWWIILCMIPLVNIVVMFILIFDLARKFGKGAGFGLGLAFLGFIFYPILAFGSAEYDENA